MYTDLPPIVTGHPWIVALIALAVGWLIRHKGIGMLIPSWPAAQPGSLLPIAWSHEVAIHFIHTRILPILITGHVIGMAIGTTFGRIAGEEAARHVRG